MRSKDKSHFERFKFPSDLNQGVLGTGRPKGPAPSNVSGKNIYLILIDLDKVPRDILRSKIHRNLEKSGLKHELTDTRPSKQNGIKLLILLVFIVVIIGG